MNGDTHGTLAMLRALVDAYARATPVRSVAVVANAPLAPSAERAACIDACDVVWRVNGFGLDGPGASAAVGRRADVIVFNRGVRATPWLFRDHRDRLYLLVEPGRLHWEPEMLPDWWPRDLGAVHVPNREVTIPLSRELGLDCEQVARWATTGTMAAWLARRLYPAAALVLAGYSFLDDPDQTSWTHGHDTPCVVGAEHVLRRDGDMLRRWLDAGEAVLHR